MRRMTDLPARKAQMAKTVRSEMTIVLKSLRANQIPGECGDRSLQGTPRPRREAPYKDKSYEEFQKPSKKRFLLLHRHRRILILLDRFIISSRLLNRNLGRLSLITAGVCIPEYSVAAVVAEHSVIGKLSAAFCTVDSHDVFSLLFKTKMSIWCERVRQSVRTVLGSKEDPLQSIGTVFMADSADGAAR